MAKKATKPRKRAQRRSEPYEPDRHPEMARCLCLAGKIDVEACAIMGISKQTWHNWRKKYPEFANAISGGKDVVDEKVEKALLARAMGYDRHGKHYPPDTVAAMYWLQNRRPERWQDTRNIKHSGNVDLTVSIKDPEGWGVGEYQAPDEGE